MGTVLLLQKVKQKNRPFASEEDHEMETRVVTLESFKIVGYQFRANLKEIEEFQLGKKTLDRLMTNQQFIRDRVSDDVYLVQLYDMKPGFNANVDPFTQVIGYKVSGTQEVPREMVVHQVPENMYVTATHLGVEAEIYKTYDFLYGTCVPENSYYPLGYDFEIWDEGYKPEQHENKIGVYVAINKKG